MAHTYNYLPVNVPAIFEQIATKTFANVMSEINVATNAQDGGMIPMYLHGTLIHIVERLTEMARDQDYNNKRFPLIAFVHDFVRRFERNDENPEIKVRIIIANLTSPDYRSEDRYRINFLPILYPIYAEFMSQLAKSNYFIRNNGLMIKHEMIDHLHWGKESYYGHSAYEMHEYIDGIEIANLELKLNIPNCSQIGINPNETKII